MILPILAAALAVMPVDGRAAYAEACASCHGANLRGGVNAPNILGVGAAAVDFWISTGRMPAALPWIENGHQTPRLPPQTIKAIVAYVTSVQPGGAAIPLVFAGGSPTRGRSLYKENCMHCHGVSAAGAAIGDQQWAPSLERATVIQVAEAIRIGPGEMPVFGESQLTAQNVDDIATYLSQRRADASSAYPALAREIDPQGSASWILAPLLGSILAYLGFRKKLVPASPGKNE